MTIYVPFHDEKLMPMPWGHPLRTPSKDWRKYRIRWDTEEEFEDLVTLGRRWYRREWEKGDANQIKIVAEASKRAFKVDNNQLLREATGKIVATYLSMQEPQEFIVIDIGAGSGLSFQAFFNNLPMDFKGEVYTILLDPASQALQEAEERVKKLGVKYEIVVDTQDNLAKHMKGRKANVIMQVASSHHDPKIPFEIFYESTQEGGLFVSGDWHPQTWQEPWYVYKMLERFDWPKKEEGLENFKKTYCIKEVPFPQDPRDRKAIFDIFDFWLMYYNLLKEYGDPGKNSIWPLEAHQDFRRYMNSLESAGYSLIDGFLEELLQEAGYKNPHYFYPDSSIIMEISAIKRSTTK
ncbi:MAG: hypothetical protein QXX38_03450 [Candidatus Aenigmatarchaeota archaeon]